LLDRVLAAGSVRAVAQTSVEVDVSGAGMRPLTTRLPLRVGDRVEAGTLLVEVSGRPVFALPGDVPSYRDLGRGAQGADVAALQTALARLRHRAGEAAGRFGPGTEAAVRAFYRQRGYQPVTEPARLVPYAEIVYVPRLPAVVTAVGTAVGQRPTGSLLILSSGTPVVDVELEPSGENRVRIGQRVNFAAAAVPGGCAGRVSSITSAGTGPPVSSGQATGAAGEDTAEAGDDGVDGDAAGGTDRGPTDAHGMRAVVEPACRLPSVLLGQSIQVSIEIARTPRPVLAVPVAAVSEAADGTAAVIRLDSGAGEQRLPVHTGTVADGFVAIERADGALAVGDLLVVGR
jgi:peptidoglycan hydrolase-like protein with peptidoglycan-binding domain